MGIGTSMTSLGPAELKRNVPWDRFMWGKLPMPCGEFPHKDSIPLYG
jgi:hypothetical protein